VLVYAQTCGSAWRNCSVECQRYSNALHVLSEHAEHVLCILREVGNGVRRRLRFDARDAGPQCRTLLLALDHVRADRCTTVRQGWQPGESYAGLSELCNVEHAVRYRRLV